VSRVLAIAVVVLLGCWPPVPDDLDADAGAAVVRVRAVEGDTFVKLKDGLARTLYRSLGSDERCVEASDTDDGHCRRRGAHLICSTENLRDPYVCELHLVDGEWAAPRADWELYHSLEANRQHGSATFDGAAIVIGGDAGEALAAQLGVSGPVTIVVESGGRVRLTADE